MSSPFMHFYLVHNDATELRVVADLGVYDDEENTELNDKIAEAIVTAYKSDDVDMAYDTMHLLIVPEDGQPSFVAFTGGYMDELRARAQAS